MNEHQHDFSVNCWIDEQPACSECHYCVKCGDPQPWGPTDEELHGYHHFIMREDLAEVEI